MSACCLKCKSNDGPYGLWLLRNVTMHGLLLLLWYVYYGIVEFSVRDKQ